MRSDVDAGEQQAAYVFLTLMAVCFGGTWVAGKVAVDAISPFTLAATRFAIASVLLWGWARSKPVGGRRAGVADLPLILGMGLTAIAGYNVLFLYGLRLARASDGAIIVPGMAPILTALVAWPLLGERIGRLGATGLLLVLTPSSGQERACLLGDVLFFLGAICWAIYTVIGKTATARFSSVKGDVGRDGHRDAPAVVLCHRRTGMDQTRRRAGPGVGRHIVSGRLRNRPPVCALV